MPHKNPVSSYHNKNLVDLFSKHLSHIEHFVFYGTLLGLVRQGQPIEGDDDVDVLVNKKHFNEVKSIVERLNFKIHDKKFPNTTKHFLQALGKIEETNVVIDFYFYDAESDPEFILEYWNQNGTVDKKDSILKIPKALIFPLTKKFYDDLEIYIPQHSEVICEYLYGSKWRIPMSQRVEYAAVCQGGKLVNFKTPQSKFLRFFVKKLMVKAVQRFIL